MSAVHRFIYATAAGLYVTDGTYAGTTLLKATATGFAPGTDMAALPDGEVVFGALMNDPTNPISVIEGVQLWVTNGTAGGTSMIYGLPDPDAGQPGDSAGLSNFVTVGSKVFFEYNDGFGDLSLYSTDGTQAGTQEIAAPVAASSVGAGEGAAMPCFAAGTPIETPLGPVAVEDLRIGDTVVTLHGGARQVVWLGSRAVNCRRHPKPETVWPVRIRRHAFAANVPCRDLWLSPDHAVFLDGVLIPIRYLVNGATIAREPRDAITYWHVELAAHDVIQAAGLACESYLDTGNRGAFAHGGPVVQMHPDFALGIWRTQACAPLVTGGAALHRARAGLLERLPALGHDCTDEAALRLLADDETALEAQIDGDWRCLALPEGARTLRLLSRHAIPGECMAASMDYRRLGVALTEVRLDDESLPLEHARFIAGWQAPEPGLRWTDGAAILDVAGARVVELRLAAVSLRYRVRLPLSDSRNNAAASARSTAHRR